MVGDWLQRRSPHPRHLTSSLSLYTELKGWVVTKEEIDSRRLAPVLGPSPSLDITSVTVHSAVGVVTKQEVDGRRLTSTLVSSSSSLDVDTVTVH